MRHLEEAVMRAATAREAAMRATAREAVMRGATGATCPRSCASGA